MEQQAVIAESSSEEKVLRVSSGTSAHSLASVISYAIHDENSKVKLRAVGAGAVNQALKAVSIARGFAAPRGFDLAVRPGFATIDSKDGTISAVVLTVFVAR